MPHTLPTSAVLANLNLDQKTRIITPTDAEIYLLIVIRKRIAHEHLKAVNLWQELGFIVGANLTSFAYPLKNFGLTVDNFRAVENYI